MSGFGSQGAGSSSAGIGPPAIGQSRPGNVLNDPATGAMSSSRAIDPVARDYQYDATTGRLTGMGDVRQLVQLAIETELGSSAEPTLGSRLRGIDRITANFDRRVNDALSAALADLVARHLVRIEGVTIQRVAPSKVFVRLQWRDLTTGVEHTTLV